MSNSNRKLKLAKHKLWELFGDEANMKILVDFPKRSEYFYNDLKDLQLLAYRIEALVGDYKPKSSYYYRLNGESCEGSYCADCIDDAIAQEDNFHEEEAEIYSDDDSDSEIFKHCETCGEVLDHCYQLDDYELEHYAKVEDEINITEPETAWRMYTIFDLAHNFESITEPDTAAYIATLAEKCMDALKKIYKEETLS
jgi:hypothetical protein